MHPLSALRSTRSRSTLLVIGLLAMLLHSLAGLAHTPRVSVGGFVGEICSTSGGAGLPLEMPGPDSVPGSGQPDCCKLSCASPSLLVGDMSLAVLPAPTSKASLASRNVDFSPDGARLVPPPRGPPLA